MPMTAALRSSYRFPFLGLNAYHGHIEGFPPFSFFRWARLLSFNMDYLWFKGMVAVLAAKGVGSVLEVGAAHDNEKGNDGVGSVVGGKASCLRNFSLDVVLLDAFGHTMNKEMEEVASFLYADYGMHVEKPRDSEAPPSTSYDEIEYASYDRPSKLLYGSASFKLLISHVTKACCIVFICYAVQQR
ncbi:hypothetical protein NE237_002708 [Protea cynaroides]|uniref:Uncharacterized protein n=1 Tax=Protea cynaroides TaxID=273540 RepID=A0A9Q0KG04_9MAGN|nr:hypothetical protein NE237_002708 [Protea cynaroides]